MDKIFVCMAGAAAFGSSWGITGVFSGMAVGLVIGILIRKVDK